MSERAKQEERDRESLRLQERVRELEGALRSLVSVRKVGERCWYGGWQESAAYSDAKREAIAVLERPEQEAREAKEREESARGWARVDALIARVAKEEREREEDAR